VQFLDEFGILMVCRSSVRGWSSANGSVRMRLLSGEISLNGAKLMSQPVRSSAEASTGNSRRGFFTSLPILESRHLLSCLALCLAANLVGCGGSSTPQSTTADPAAQPAASSGPVGFAKRVEDEVDETVDLSGIDPNDVFDMSTSPPPNFVVVGAASKARPEDQFVAAIDPAAGTSQFVIAGSSASTSAAGNGNASNAGTSSGGTANAGTSNAGNANATVSLPPGFTAVAGGPLVDGRPSRIVCQADQSEMILIPAGKSVVGTLKGPKHCVPEVSVALDAFYISELEINVAQFGEFRSRSIKNGAIVNKPLNVDAGSSHPALGIAWVEARNYAKSSGRELPTECQWEKAARGSKGLSAPWGNGRPLWREPRDIGQIDSCGMFLDDRSVYGVFDMAGNAREWLLDFFSETNHEDLGLMEPARRTNWSGPRRASQSGQRVVKGDGPEWAVWFRRGQLMTERNPNVGFRCVLNLSSGD
jgi:formylglycine-generating enzyme